MNKKIKIKKTKKIYNSKTKSKNNLKHKKLNYKKWLINLETDFRA